MAERASLDLDSLEDDDIDLQSLASTKRDKGKVDKDELSRVSEEAGFVSRQAKKRRRRGNKTAYTQQKNIRMRPGMNDLFVDVAEELGVKDYELFEMAFRAFLQKQKLKEFQDRFADLTK